MDGFFCFFGFFVTIGGLEIGDWGVHCGGETAVSGFFYTRGSSTEQAFFSFRSGCLRCLLWMEGESEILDSFDSFGFWSNDTTHPLTTEMNHVMYIRTHLIYTPLLQ
jgi:hypothetical protein